MKKKLVLLFGVMLILAGVGAIIINLVNTKVDTETTLVKDKLQVVTTFYPVYMIGINIAGQSEDIEVKSLTELNTGCLHDYQLTTEDMKIISSADILVINGGGMEGFLEDVETNYPKLTIIDASKGMTMLQNEADESKDEETTVGGKLGHSAYNPHVWLDPKLYVKQIENVKEGIIKYLNEINSDTNSGTSSDTNSGRSSDTNSGTSSDTNSGTSSDTNSGRSSDTNSGTSSDTNSSTSSDTNSGRSSDTNSGTSSNINSGTSFDINTDNLKQNIEQNAQTYIQEVLKLDADFEEISKNIEPASDQGIKDQQVVIFHDSFAYLANRIGMTVAFTVPLDSDTALSAGDIAGIIDAVKADDIKYLFTEQQYSDSIAKQIEAETDAKVYIIDSVVTGNGSKDSYIKAMQKNLQVIKDALQ